MTPVTSFRGRKVALFGLGGSGLATARALLAGGAQVAAWDDGEAGRARAAAEGIALVDLRTADFAGFAALVLSPGVPLTHPAPHWAAARALAAGVVVIGDIELFCRERAAIAPGSPFVAITGTNGKSTTTALLAHILASAGRNVAMGGNIGVAILDLPPPAMDRIHVIECSSFQIDLAPSLRPTIGILTNVTPDHLDRHGDMTHYAAIKARLVKASDFAIASADDDYSSAIPLTAGVTISARKPVADGVYFQANDLWLARPGAKPESIASLAGAGALRGAHNGQNAAAAAAAALHLGISAQQIATGMQTFPGLKHRMEQAGQLGKVLFINDSKATNADSTQKAMLSFDDMFLILGGKPKEGGIESLRPLFPKIRKAYLIGAASDEFAGTLGPVPHEFCGTLDRAVAAAARDAAASDAREPVVLLSPACASYDQFANFEVRGDYFRALVQSVIAAGEKNP